MVQVIAAAAIGAVAWVGYNAFKKHMAEERRKTEVFYRMPTTRGNWL